MPEPLTPPAGSLGERIRDIRFRLAASRRETISRASFGRIVASLEGRKRAYDSSTVQRWEEGSEPSLFTMRAIARLAGVSFEWLAFGEEEATNGGRPAPTIEWEEPGVSEEREERGSDGRGKRPA